MGCGASVPAAGDPPVKSAAAVAATAAPAGPAAGAPEPEPEPAAPAAADPASEDTAVNAGDKKLAFDQLLNDLSENMGLNSLIFTVTQGIPRVVGAEICTVYLCDYSKSELWSVATGSGSEFRIPISMGLAGHVATHNETMRIADCYQDPRWQGHEMDKKNNFKTRNMLVFPICAPGEAEKPVGVLQIINKIGGAFDSADEELLAAFSNKAAPLISAHPMYYKHEEEQSTEAEALSGTSPSPKASKKARSRRPSVEMVQEEDEEEEEEEEDEDDE